MKLLYAGKKVLVTGGSCAIGLALAKDLVDEGLLPVLTFRTEKGKEKILKSMEAYSGRFETAFFDLNDMSAATGLFKETNSDPDYLVDLAHTDYESLVASASNEKIQDYFQANVTARATLVRSAARSMLKKKFGRLVFISSAAAVRPGTGQGFYTSSKQAGEALYKNCGLELCSRGVTSISLRPGFVDAGRGKSFFKKKESGYLKKTIGKKRPVMVSVEDLCAGILFFLSDRAHVFNGVAVTLDHGLSSEK